MSATIAFVLKGYPRLSETFIAQEILALERRGLAIRIVSLRRPTDGARHPVHDEIKAGVLYLPEYLGREPRRLLAAWRAGRRRPGYRAARGVWLADLRRDATPNRVRRFGQALVLAAELPTGVTHLHAHFLHTPASVARYASLLTGLPWSCSAHAKDIWTTPEWEKAEKLADAAWLVTCTRAGRDHLAALAPRPERVELAYHGLDFERFPRPDGAPSERDGGAAGEPVVILSVGRAVEKKGYDVLLRALASLPEALHWRLVHVGGGHLGPRLGRQAEAAGLAHRVTWLGACPQAEVIANYRAADLFVLPCRVARDGDRDGLPNVLLEAQSQGLACISSRGLGRARAHRGRRHRAAGAARGRRRPGRGAAAPDHGTRPARPPWRARLPPGSRPLFPGPRDRSHRRPPRDARRGRLTVRVAFYAPMKAPTAPTPSGDRGIARLFMAAMAAAGHRVELAARLRAFEGAGDASRQARIGRAGGLLAARLVRRYRARPRRGRPEVWFTYHVYHKAPDWIGPAVSEALSIPYILAEASVAARHAAGPWSGGHDAAVAAVRRADCVLGLNARDGPAVARLLGDARRLVPLPLFLDAAPFAAAAEARGRHRARLARRFGLDAGTPWLVTVAMMRPGGQAGLVPGPRPGPGASSRQALGPARGWRRRGSRRGRGGAGGGRRQGVLRRRAGRRVPAPVLRRRRPVRVAGGERVHGHGHPRGAGGGTRRGRRARRRRRRHRP